MKPALLVSLLLVAALVVRLALGLGQLLEPAPDHPATLAGTATQAPQAVDLDTIRALDLFAAGSAAQTASAPVQQVNVPRSRLNYTLEGVMLAAGEAGSFAVIAGGQGQRIYRSGDSISDAVTLDRIGRDHVIIINRGSAEALWLDPDDGAGARRVQRQAAGTGQADAGTVAGMRKAVISGEISSAVAQLAEIMQVSPEYANGALIGYRISPGDKLREFVRLGFESGDVLTAANGLALNDMSKLPELYSLMNEGTEVTFTLLRQGEPKQLTIRLESPDAAGNQ